MHDLLSLIDAYDEDAGAAEYFVEICNCINNKDVIWYAGCYEIDVIHVNIKEGHGL